MAVTLLNEANYQESLWSGGTTCQIAIEPAKAMYADRAFLWRMSSATVELEASSFTPLPDYERLISTLTGAIELQHEGEEKIVINPFEIHAFDGAFTTHSFGQCTDFNLMLRKQVCTGSLQAIHLTENIHFSFMPTVLGKSKNHTVVIYCHQGDVTINILGQTYQLAANNTLILSESDANQMLSLNAKLHSDLMLAQISFSAL